MGIEIEHEIPVDRLNFLSDRRQERRCRTCRTHHKRSCILTGKIDQRIWRAAGTVNGIIGNADDFELSWIARIEGLRTQPIRCHKLCNSPTKAFSQRVRSPKVTTRHGFVDNGDIRKLLRLVADLLRGEVTTEQQRQSHCLKITGPHVLRQYLAFFNLPVIKTIDRNTTSPVLHPRSPSAFHCGGADSCTSIQSFEYPLIKVKALLRFVPALL